MRLPALIREWRSWANAGLLFLAASTIVNVANFGFHIIVSRTLGADRYGGLGAMLAVTTAVAVPLSGLQLAVAKSQVDAGKEVSAHRFLRRSGLASAGLAAALAFLAPVLESFFHLSSPAPALWLTGWFAATMAGAAAQGVLMGRTQFGVIAVASLVGGGFTRIVLALPLAQHAGVAGAMAATTLAQVVTTLVMFGALAGEPVRGAQLSVSLKGGVLSTFALTGLAVATGIDSVLARHFLSGSDSGIYSGAAVAGRIALFAPAALAVWAFPSFVEARRHRAARQALISRFMTLILTLGTAAAMVLVVFPRPVIAILLGDGYQPAVQALGLLGIEGACLGVLTLVVYFQLARESRLALLGWVIALITGVGIWFTHRDPHVIAVVTTAVVGLMTLLGVLATLAAQSVPRAARNVEPANMQSGAGGIDLTLVMPFYNPGPRLREHLLDVVDVLDGTGIAYEVIPVADGCTDGSERCLDGLSLAHVRPIVSETNVGKGHAVRIGLMRGRGRYLGFVDADGDLPASLLREFVHVAMTDTPHFAIGSKRHPQSDVVYPRVRRIYSWGYQQLVRVLFGLAVRDTQTGLKIVRRDVLVATMPRMLEKRYAFDLEMLVVARQLGYDHIVELPVTILRRISSTISIRALRYILRDTLAVFYRLRVLSWYDEEPLDPAPVSSGAHAALPEQAVVGHP